MPSTTAKARRDPAGKATTTARTPVDEAPSLASRGRKLAVWAVLRVLQAIVVVGATLALAVNMVPSIFAVVLRMSGANASSSGSALGVTVFAPAILLCALFGWGIACAIRWLNRGVNALLSRWDAHLVAPGSGR